MNLIKKEITQKVTQDYILFENFRKEQYKLIPEFVRLCIDFISKQNNNYLEINHINFEKKINYKDVNHNELHILECFIDIKNKNLKNQLFFRLYIPSLLFNNLFYLNGNYYAPTVYLLDKPIVIKKKSIFIDCLFNSLTFNFSRNVVTFTGINIPIHLFLILLQIQSKNDYFLEKFIKAVKKNINKKFKLKDETEDNVLNYFSRNINCKKDPNEIVNYFNNLMFDDYTKYIFEKCYNLKQVNLMTVFNKITNIINLDKNSFVNLKNKRLVFVELLLLPLFKKVSKFAVQSSRGFEFCELKINLIDIIKNFNIFLKSNYLYDTGNLYSCLLQHKISMLNPGSERGPREISSIHKSHFGKLCPITVSSQEPGKTVSIIPETKMDIIGRIL